MSAHRIPPHPDRPGTPTKPSDLTVGQIIYEPLSGRPLKIVSISPYQGVLDGYYQSIVLCEDGTRISICRDDDLPLNWPRTLTP